MYTVLFSKKAAEAIRSLEAAYKLKLREIIESLEQQPFSYPYKKIRGEINLYRIRVGGYRLLYTVDKVKREIIILKVDKRSKAYQ